MSYQLPTLDLTKACEWKDKEEGYFNWDPRRFEITGHTFFSSECNPLYYLCQNCDLYLFKEKLWCKCLTILILFKPFYAKNES